MRYRGSVTVRGGMTITSSSRCLLAAKRYRGGMTVCGDMTVRGGMTITSSSRYLLAGSMLRDTAAV
ncbi:hypothetical protein [Wolbachia endosymbiont (group A) of Rhinocyllus conicus]|uniref:hypothetical protein n=1 Tax=Wolbachia endosymbiont (group A) of Rhinocyllus conicus TaxID=2954053 RepID=UPI002226D20D|nr:hypothetical protein [Wolbachia endosymbiont (group A) of Rhinocyllus conicus]